MMKECDLAALGLTFRETIKRWDYGLEVHTALYSTATSDLVASFSTTTRTSNGEQILCCSMQFNQLRYLTIGQIDAVTGWLRDYTLGARWRLSTYTTLAA